jgi:hypothetical protein
MCRMHFGSMRCADSHAITADIIHMQAAPFRTITRTEERRLTEVVHEVATFTTNCSATERKLMAAAGKNPYQQALLLIRIAPFQADQHQQV